MISKYYILKNSVYFRKRIEAGSVDAAEQERESRPGGAWPESFQKLWWAPAPQGRPSSEQAAPPALPAEEAWSSDWGWRREQAAHTFTYRERTLGAEFLTEPLACASQTHGHQLLGKGWSVCGTVTATRASSCQELSQREGPGPGAGSARCVRAPVQGEKRLFQE